MIVPTAPVFAIQAATAPKAAAEGSGRGQHQQPRESDLTPDAPAHGAGPARRCGTEDRAGGDLRGGQREAQGDHSRRHGMPTRFSHLCIGGTPGISVRRS